MPLSSDYSLPTNLKSDENHGKVCGGVLSCLDEDRRRETGSPR